MRLTEFLIQEKIDGETILPPSKDNEHEYSMYAEREHNARVLRLGNYLLKTGEFDVVYPFCKYKRDGFEGEIDLFAEREDLQAWFEVKFKFHPLNLQKAVIQFKRYQHVFPEFTGRAYYVSCDGMVVEISNKKVLSQFD